MADAKLKKQVLRVALFALLVFMALGCYLIYLSSYEADDLARNPMNPREAAARSDIIRGSILDRNGNILVETKSDGTRSYAMGEVMAAVTGYSGSEIGSAGIEGHENRALLGLTEDMGRMGPAAQLLQSDRGNDVQLTVDARIQQAAYEGLGGSHGAVVVMDAHTGAILAMASTPSYDPNNIEATWTSLSKQVDGALLNRAVQGMYPPGSTIKPMIADAALTEGVATEREIINCTGVLDVGNGFTIREYNNEAHGRVNLRQALVESCNITFGTLGMRLGDDRLARTYKRFGFSEGFGGDISMEAANLPDFGHLTKGDQAQASIGQGTLLVTPLNMALLADAYANGGKIMKPYLVQEILSQSGTVLSKTTPEVWRTATTPDIAATIDSYMEEAVQKGTGRAASVKGIRVTGKTGTAETGHGTDHAWFIGSAQLKKQKIVFAIVVENAGSGGRYAAPIARHIIQTMLESDAH